MTATASESSATTTSQPLSLFAPREYHRCLWLPADDKHERLRITFATTTNFEDESLPAVLFAGPMFGTRYSALTFTKLATETGVRVICIDRPGLGGASPVNVKQRIDVWLEAVPAILARLGVKHVSLLSHSAGTLFSLNTLSRLRSILDPDIPYVSFLAPWVHNDHSNVALINIVANLPTGAFSYWSGLSKIISQKIMPASEWSGGLITSVSDIFTEQTGIVNDDEAAAQEKFGVSKTIEKQIDALQGKYVFAEGMSGANDEALLCAKKAGSWGACEDYMQYVQQLLIHEQERRAQDDTAAKLRIRMHFAASDVMIGEGGKEYFPEMLEPGRC